ncbi:MAG TPA: PDZ domain-containing protein [Spirochaetota bacterium]|nr:PDZ domain-containing protein [Spirochaetota bacterium]HPI88135.1 PDZ domain-containing protein [Spirochaetota bacterium]HPR47910.1 PDZ domain-containing protein [Spirochaetota bacterium]
MKRNFLITLVCILALPLFISCLKESNFGRLGIEVPTGEGKISDETPYVIHSVYEGPAFDAGIKADDVIVQINDVPLRKGMTHEYVYNNLLLGKAGTKVTLVVDRKGERLVFEIVRASR